MKEYTNQQRRSATVLNEITINCNHTNLTEKPWDAFSRHFQSLAIMNEGVVGVEDAPPSAGNIERYVSIKSNNRFYNQATLAEATFHTLCTASQREALVVNLFKYGNALLSSTNFRAFSRQILEPRVADRAGAARHQIISELEEQLRETHGRTYRGEGSNWMVWASFIASQPTNEHARLVSDPPPRHLIHLFDSVPDSAEARVGVVRQNVRIAQNAIENIQAQVQRMQEVFDNVSRGFENLRAQMEGLQHTLGIYGSVMPDFDNSLHPNINLGGLYESDISEQEDVDHPESD